MRQMNLRLVDWFMKLDADGSQSLTREEFKEGLQVSAAFNSAKSKVTYLKNKQLPGCSQLRVIISITILSRHAF